MAMGAGALSFSIIGVSYYLDMSANDWLYALHIKTPKDIVPRGAQVIELPKMLPPDEYVHPFSDRPWWWQWGFTVRRALELVFLSTPLLWATVKLTWYNGAIEVRDQWCQCPPAPPVPKRT